jgi:glutamate/tyrosine decarboxylase-like PLP-dependent enzyme
MERSSALELTPEEFRKIGHRLVDRMSDFLSDLRALPVTPAETPAQIREAIDGAAVLPELAADPSALIERAADLLISHSLFNGHPRFFGYITSSAAPIGALGDFMASVLNLNVGAWNLAPAATEIEAQTVRWIAEFMGYPADSCGLLVSGGNMANFIGFLAGRAAKLGTAVRKEGLRGLRKQPRCYCSAGTHTWIQKAADLSGLGTDSIRWIPIDGQQRLDLARLKAQVASDIEAGDEPFLVAGTAGSVSTGAVDPLPEVAEFCRERGLWFHVDGAYGGIAAKVPGAPPELAGLAFADSVAVDPHKWLYAPLEAGCILVRRMGDLLDAFSYHPSYYNFDKDAINYFDLGPQNSRGFRALKVWLGLQQAGRSGYLRTMAEDIALADHAFGLFSTHPEFEAATRSLSICTFRYVPAELRSGVGSDSVEQLLNRLNQELLSRIEKSGEAFLSNAVLDGRFLLRLCIVNFRTSFEDVECLPALIARLGNETFMDMQVR